MNPPQRTRLYIPAFQRVAAWCKAIRGYKGTAVSAKTKYKAAVFLQLRWNRGKIYRPYEITIFIRIFCFYPKINANSLKKR